jgi:hypothetical protein
MSCVECGQWCPRKRLTPQQLLDNERYYRCKTKDAKLYQILKGIFDLFVSLDRLQEVAHGVDTQVNESFNNTASWFAPKNKVYCGTRSLHNRIGMAIGINSLGLLDYFKRPNKTYGIAMTPNVMHFWTVNKERNRQKRLKNLQTREYKKLRMKRKFEQLKEDEKIAKRERSKREGSYKPGQNMKEDDDEDPLAPPRRNNSNLSAAVCPHCGKRGHKTTRSKLCKHHNQQDKQLATGRSCFDGCRLRGSSQ